MCKKALLGHLGAWLCGVVCMNFQNNFTLLLRALFLCIIFALTFVNITHKIKHAMKDRMNFIRRSEGLSLAQLANILGTNPSTLTHITSGRNKPSYDILSAIAAKLPQYNLRWLLTGEGEPLVSDVKTDGTDFLPDAPQTTTPQEGDEIIMAELFAVDMDNSDSTTADINSPSSLPTSHEPLSPVAEPATAKQPLGEVATVSAAPTERLIVCFPDHTFAEYTRRQE